MRPCQPDRSDFITRDGVKVAFDVYGDGNAPTLFLLPTWAIIHALHWKLQVPVLARRYRVITMDGRGNGRSDRPDDPVSYSFDTYATDAIAVMDATGTERAVLLGVCTGGALGVYMAATHPDRVLGAVVIEAGLPHLSDPIPERATETQFTQVFDDPQRWQLFNEHVWETDYRRFVEFFWREAVSEPHSTKVIEDLVDWSLETDGHTLVTSVNADDPQIDSKEQVVDLLRQVRCPTLLIHGSADRVLPLSRSEAMADLLGGDLIVIEGGGHCPQARDPIVINREIVDFVERVTPPADRRKRRKRWVRAMSRPQRALYLSSPIGLGHARRDLAICRALREELPGLEIDWLAQEPVTTFLAGTGETVHDASAELANESAHIASESSEHSLHAFQAIRRMDEILLANFSVFQDLVDSGDYDVVVADEAWDVEYFWHENPELKRTAFVWMTDFVGWLPMPSGGAAEQALTADYNAEMVEHVSRFRRIRDRSIFVGDLDDVVEDDFGPGLPNIRQWTSSHFDFSGYITGFDSDELADRVAIRRRLGYDPEQPLVVVTVGGSGVGEALLRKVIEAAPWMNKEIGGLRLVAVAGPRIDPGLLPSSECVEVRGYVPDLHLHLAACDGAIVQGGLTSTMELVANRRPFLYFPLGDHFEQQRHVRHRLERHNAGLMMDYSACDAEEIAIALTRRMAAPLDYLPVPSDGAQRAARLIAELL